MNLSSTLLEKRAVSRFILIGLLFSILIFNFIGEKAYNEGAGWDGLIYRDMIKSFSETFTNNGYSNYYITRTAPWAFIHYVNEIFHLPSNNQFFLFEVLLLNFICLGLSVFCFFRISNFLNLKASTEAIGFASLFFIYPVVKLSGYYPFMTDIIALCTMLFSYYFFLVNNRWGLIFIGLISGFIWPTAWLLILMLLFFPRSPFSIVEEKGLSAKNIKILNWLKLFFILGIFLAGLAILSYFFFYRKYDRLQIPNNYHYTTAPLQAMIGLLVFAGFIWLTIKNIKFSISQFFISFWKESSKLNLILFVVLLLGMKLIVAYVGNEKIADPFSTTGLIVRLLGEPIVYPLQFLETHFIYYGLLLVLVIIFWSQLLSIFGQYGFGYISIILYILIFSTQSESRFLINMIPFLLFPVLIVLNKYNLYKWVPAAFIVFNLAFSKFWYPINVKGTEEAFIKEDLLNFPAQRYFMSQGPWQSFPMYILHLTLFFVVLGMVYIGVKKNYFGKLTLAKVNR